MRRSYTPALAVGIGAVAGLRTLAAPAVLAWAAKRRWIRLGNSPFATIISAQASTRLTDLAVSELIADKLPFTPSRLKAGPLASRVVSGAVCGATIYGVVERPLVEGAVLGGVGAIAGALALQTDPGAHRIAQLMREARPQAFADEAAFADETNKLERSVP